ncbi:hypothetical protein PL2TA16_00532 [Pseudoalteromonas luteoviolacea 2ta16]|uniref:Uncharacterized protein n=1 Tax=Pseudoalteromonas luteoviolacea (strain 2ta16) TaxID=1353533 RepID=V4JHX9_PSEL2|nr:hypothetical protein PL2TA16_00532 [Pseudoalteromonas luteoviolacea 2ta16]
MAQTLLILRTYGAAGGAASTTGNNTLYKTLKDYTMCTAYLLPFNLEILNHVVQTISNYYRADFSWL